MANARSLHRVAIGLTIATLGVFAFARLRSDPGEIQPNVVIVSLDTVRADAVGNADTPFLNEFLETARWFQGARTVTPLTFPSHASIFTGLMPHRHGIHDNVNAPVPRTNRAFSLLAEEYQRADYETIAFVARAVLKPETGLDEGFDDYHAPSDDSGRSSGYRRATEQVARFQRWMASRKSGKPFFAWVHLFDAHQPHITFEGDDKRPATASAATQDLYRGEIRRIDAALETMLRGLGRDTIVVLVSDHGEGLNEHDEPTHGPLCFSTTIDAVLIVRARQLGRGIDKEARSVCDIAPSLRAWCHLLPQRSDGVPLDQSRDRRVVTSESLFTHRIHGWGQCFSAFDGRYSLVEHGTMLALFDRRSDPGETRPLKHLGHAAFERLDRALIEMRTHGYGSNGLVAPIASVTPYGFARRVGATYVQRHENAKLTNPQDHLDDWGTLTGLETLLGMAAQRRDPNALRRTITRIEKLARRVPASPYSYQLLAAAQASMGSITNEPRWFRAAFDSMLISVDRGHRSASSFQSAMYCAIRLHDKKRAATVVARMIDVGTTPDESCAEVLVAAARAHLIESSTCLQLVRAMTPEAPTTREKVSHWIAEFGG